MKYGDSLVKLAVEQSAAEPAPALPVGTYVVRRLRDAGARVAFGIPGRSIHWLLAALARAEAEEVDPLRFVLARHEGGAAFMADGYARVSGRLGVCLVTAGPGVTHAATGALCAQARWNSG